MFENYLDINEVKEIRAQSLIYFGCGAVKKMNDIAAELKKSNIEKVLVISTPSAYKKSGAWETIEEALRIANIEWTLYNKVTPNPDTNSIDEVTKIGLDFGAGAIIGIGGGSPIDVAKSAAVLMVYRNKTAMDLYEWKFTPEKALPIIAVNLTHGTGTECDRFAVASILEKQYKPAIACDCIYPKWSIDDPQLMLTLPLKQILYTSIDAMNHVIEAATSKVANPFSITLAREVIALNVKYLHQAMKDPQDLTARYNLAYAALLGGISFDNGFLHYTHALEHPLSAMKPEVIHGCGLGVLLPAVLKNIYPACAAVLADILAPISPDLKGIASAEEAEQAAIAVENWLFNIGANHKLLEEGFTENDIPRLVDLVFSTPSLSALLGVAPTTADRAAVEEIYRKSLKPMSQH